MNSRCFYSVLMAVASLAVLNSIQPLRADDPKNVEMKGTLITPPPCSLNGGNTVYVSFGDKVGIRKVASGVYRQPVLLDLECEDNNQAWQMTLTYTGKSASFDTDGATVVTPEQESLGVKLFANSKPLPLNKVVPINGDSFPLIEAVLIQKPDVALSEGEFTARATLHVGYQ